MRFLGCGRKKVPPPTPRTDIVSILERNKDGDKVKLRVKLQGRTLEDLSNFTREHAFFNDNDVLSELFEYGITKREGIDIEGRRPEVIALGSRYAAMRFEAYELYSDNRVMTMSLSLALQENRRLRKLAEARGLIQPRKEPWDNWTKGEVDYFHKRYLFAQQGLA